MPFPKPPARPPWSPTTQLPLFEADVFGADPAWDATVFETDFAHFRPSCDVLCHAKAHAPNGDPVTSVDVGIRLGQWAKKFTVHGSRIWLRGASGHSPSAKRPFLQQDIGYDHAYGGIDPEAENPGMAKTFDENPVGLGYYPNSPEPRRLRAGAHLGIRSGCRFPRRRLSPDGLWPGRAQLASTAQLWRHLR